MATLLCGSRRKTMIYREPRAGLMVLPKLLMAQYLGDRFRVVSALMHGGEQLLEKLLV